MNCELQFEELMQSKLITKQKAEAISHDFRLIQLINISKYYSILIILPLTT